jgi:hypothetical protein
LRLALATLAAALLLLPATGRAGTYDPLDPLHGVCNGTGTGTCSDNGTNTPLGNSTVFGFTSSPPGATGDLTVDVLIPNNDAIPLALKLLNAAGTTTIGTFAQFTNTTLGAVWNANDLGINFLNNTNPSPNQPIGAFLPTTQGVDPGATGFFILRLDVGTETLSGNDFATSTVDFQLGGNLPVGAYIVADLVNLDQHGNTQTIENANSGALLVGTPFAATPIPGAVWLFGTGAVGMIGLMRRRKKMPASVLGSLA